MGLPASAKKIGEKVNMRRHFKKILVAILVVLVVTFCRGPDLFTPLRAERATQSINRSNVRQLAIACRIYAFDHEGHFPMDLRELEPEYLFHLKELSYIVDNREKPPVVKDWAYFGAGFTLEQTPPILIAAPDFYVARSAYFRFGASKFRVYARGDETAIHGHEEEYQKLLTETNRQRLALPEPAKAPPEKP